MRGAGVVRAAVTARACLGIYVACVLMLGERVGRRGWAGAVLVGAGIAAVALSR